MTSKRKSKGKKINPTFYVFCEGQTEEEYVKFLRSVYRIPIEIDSKRSGNDISKRYINSYLRAKTQHKKDKIFLMYDLDVDGVLRKLRELNETLLVSNPCIELWFLLHYRDQRANISGANCKRALCKQCPDYEKGKLTNNIKQKLIDDLTVAKQRSQQLNRHNNPSTTIDTFIDELDQAKQMKNES